MAFNALRLGLTNLFLGLKLVWCVGLRLEDWFTRFMIFDFQFYWEVSQVLVTVVNQKKYC